MKTFLVGIILGLLFTSAWFFLGTYLEFGETAIMLGSLVLGGIGMLVSFRITT